MTLVELIQRTKKDEKRIRQEHAVMVEFQKTNPWLLEEILTSMKENGEEDVPTVEELLLFKDNMLLTDIKKVYQQIKVYNPLFLTEKSVEVLYYTYNPQFYKSQQKQGLQLGDRDGEGNIVTGSNLVIEVATINYEDFINTYYSLNN